MALAKPRTFRIEDFQALPEVVPSLEFFGERVLQKMSPKLPHSVIQGELYFTLQAFARPTRIGRVYPELRCDFGGSSHVFDLSFFIQDRRPDPTNPRDCERVTQPPDLAVEILSPGQTSGELTRKLRSAIRRGVRLGWLVDDRRRQVLVLRPGVRAQALKLGDVLDGGEVLPGFALPVAEIFGWLTNS